MLFVMIAVIGLTGCSTNRLVETVKEETISKELVTSSSNLAKNIMPLTMPTPVPTPEPVPEDCYATIVSFGDTLCHKPLYNAAYDNETGIYDFSYMFEYVEKYFKNSTINIGNCESPMAGLERGYSGYPCFNAPEHLAIDLQELGVDIMTTANNHTLDKGFSGLSTTLDFLDKSGIQHVGTARNESEQDCLLFLDLNGIKTAFIAYTYGTNGIPIPEGKDFCVNLIDEVIIERQISRAKNEGAELIVASMHWGVEYQTTENAEQDRLAKFLIENDVDIILGSHPHVLQPMKMLKVETEEGETKEGLVIFSQGNFFSNQRDVNTRNTAIFNIEVKKDGQTGDVRIEKATYVPLYMYIKEPGAENRYQLLDLNEIIRSYESGEDIWSEAMYQLALKEKERCVRLIGPEITHKEEGSIMDCPLLYLELLGRIELPTYRLRICCSTN